MKTNSIINFKCHHVVLVLFIILFIFVREHAFAKDYGTPQILNIQNRDGRILYAKELASFFKKIDEYIPSLSPSQNEWLRKEMDEYKKSRNFSRYREISNSKEFKINNIKTYLGSINNELNLIIKSQQLKEEIYHWSLIAEQLMEVSFWSTLHILIEEHGLVDKKLFYSDPIDKIDQYTFYLNNSILPAEQVIRNIIQPYLLNSELVK